VVKYLRGFQGTLGKNTDKARRLLAKDRWAGHPHRDLLELQGNLKDRPDPDDCGNPPEGLLPLLQEVCCTVFRVAEADSTPRRGRRSVPQSGIRRKMNLREERVFAFSP
jgi:hypothetical protein